VQAAVHRIAQLAFGYLTAEVLGPVPHNTAYMTRQFEVKLAEFLARGGAPEIHRLARDRVAERSGLFGLCAGPVLCHNDLHEGNVLVEPAGDGWRVTGVVDVENAIAADPLMDLAKTIQYERTGSRGSRCTGSTTRWSCGTGSRRSATPDHWTASRRTSGSWLVPSHLA
jgi:hygromycin-B 7''-O-kinase